ncbi:MAG: hypothetical protein Q9167_003396 [Letrouitia subvulpina]
MSNTRPSRLKPVRLDPLDSIGLVSKGDISLLDPKIQESYFSTIRSRCTQHLSSVQTPANSDEALAAAISLLSLQQSNNDNGVANAPLASPPSIEQREISSKDRDLSIILLSMRKLRESLVSTSRNDAFALQVYTFIIRSAILLAHPESYHPALLHLLRRLHPQNPLSKEEETEFVIYHVLDLACRQNDLAEAFWMRNYYGLINRHVDLLLKALVSRNWVLYWKVKSHLDGYSAKLAEWAEDGMRKNAIECLGRSYLSLKREFLENHVKRNWRELKERDGVTWACDGDAVIIRQMRKR